MHVGLSMSAWQKWYILEKCSKMRVLRFLKSGPSVKIRFGFWGFLGILWSKFKNKNDYCKLRLLSCKLQMSTALTEDQVKSRLQFSWYCHQQFWKGNSYLARIFFSHEWTFSVPRQVHKQIWQISRTKRPMRCMKPSTVQRYRENWSYLAPSRQ